MNQSRVSCFRLESNLLQFLDSRMVSQFSPKAFPNFLFLQILSINKTNNQRPNRCNATHNPKGFSWSSNIKPLIEYESETIQYLTGRVTQGKELFALLIIVSIILDIHDHTYMPQKGGYFDNSSTSMPLISVISAFNSAL